ncbi:hypothetical protein SDC9_109714 [bioreactor metagenome]|uniref:Uncharacterized protein n=1 Tax=bioreactor metagenome TaxID=1076179 RepID=A0A645BCL4_9ZZZZ
MTLKEKILIGGRALVALGSSRNTLDIYYLVDVPESKEPFLHEGGVDYCNASGLNFFRDVYKLERGNQMASPQSLLDLKAYAWVQHCLNGNFRKADEAEFDIKFLIREFGLTGLTTVKKYLSDGERAEVEKIINSVLSRQNGKKG